VKITHTFCGRVRKNYSGAELLRARVCYAITSLQEPLKVVRSSRSSGGKIRYETIIASDKAAWDQFLGEVQKPRIISVCCLSVRESLTLWLNAPFSSRTKATKVFPSLLDIQLPFPLEECMYQFPDIRQMPDKTFSALAVAARLENIQECLRSYKAHGINPVLFDHEGLALWTQSIREMPPTTESTRVIFYISDDHVTIVIGEGERFINANSINNSVCHHSDSVSAGSGRISTNPDGSIDMLAGQIERFLHAEIKLGTSVQWVACGTGALNTSLVETLHHRLSEEWPGTLTLHGEPEIFLARALCIRALGRQPLPCNFRSQDLTHPVIMREARRMTVLVATLFVITALFLCVINAAWHIISSRRLSLTKNAISTLAASIAPDVRIQYGQELRETKNALDKQSELAKPFLNALGPFLSVRLANIINAGKRYHLIFETLSLEQNTLSISGTAEDWDECEYFADHLRKMGYSIALERQEAIADTLVHFSVKGDVTAQVDRL